MNLLDTSKIRLPLAIGVFLLALLALGPATSFVAADGPPLVIVKKVNGVVSVRPSEGPPVAVGDTVTLELTVTNNSGGLLGDVVVTDQEWTPPDNLGDPIQVCSFGSLAPGDSGTCSITTTALPGLHGDKATATATGTPPVSTYGHYFGVAPVPSIGIVKSTNGSDANDPPGPYVVIGATVNWTYLVANTGNITLSGIVVTDDRGVAVTCPQTALAPGESMTCTAGGTAIAGQYTNIGTATGTPAGGLPNVSASDPSNYFGRPAAACTPGYWKNKTRSWAPTGYSPTQTVGSVFTATSFPSLGSSTLLQGLSFKGGTGLDGAAQILLRASIAALLNAAGPATTYPLTPAEVVSRVNAALASGNRQTMLDLGTLLDGYNNGSCPLN